MGFGGVHIPRRLTGGEVNALFAEQWTRDPVGYRIHLGLALIGCFLIGWPTSTAEWAMLPVLICFLVRMTGQHRILEPLAFDRVFLLLVMWTAWAGLSVLWSAGREGGSRAWLTDIQALRFVAVPLVLWPVMDRRGWLLAAVLAGIACGELSQAAHGLGVLMDAAWTPFHRMPGRVSGWWDPVVGGSVLCGALGVWLGGAVYGTRARSRWACVLAALGTIGCIALTGTRGAWIGAGMLALIAAVLGAMRTRWRRAAAAGVLGAGVLMGGAGTLACVYVATTSTPEKLPAIGQRLRQGIEEVRAAEDPRGYESDTGLRLAMWKWGWAALRTHPLLGVGAGGYQPWVRSRTPEEAAALRAPAGAIPHVHAHAHSWYLHTFATLGMIGGSLLAWLIGSAAAAGGRGGGTGLQCGVGLGILGLACAGVFDSITVNQQTMCLFCTLVALALPSRPSGLQEGAA